jgi:hypothetical protein
VSARLGDWLLENAGTVAVVSEEGSVVDFGPEGGRDEITAIAAAVFLGLDAGDADTVSPRWSRASTIGMRSSTRGTPSPPRATPTRTN